MGPSLFSYIVVNTSLSIGLGYLPSAQVGPYWKCMLIARKIDS